MEKKRYLITALVGCVNTLHILLLRLKADGKYYRDHLWLSKYSFPDIEKGDEIQFTAEKSFYYSRVYRKDDNSSKVIQKKQLVNIKNVKKLNKNDSPQ